MCSFATRRISFSNNAATGVSGLAADREFDWWTFVWGAHARSLYLHMPGPAGPRAPYLDHIRALRQADPQIATGAIGYITDPNEGEKTLTAA